MSAYTTKAAIQTRIPAPWLLAALDDLGDGTFNDAQLNDIITFISLDIDGRLSPIYSVPFTNPPVTVQAACLVMCCEVINQRRLAPEEKNVFTPQADMWRKYLDDISTNKRDLDYTQDRAFPPVVAIQFPLTTAGNSR